MSDNDRFYDCGICLDSGYAPVTTQRGSITYHGVTFCDCERGVPIAAGVWRDKLRPEVAGKRVDSMAGRREFKVYRSRYPAMAAKILDYLERCPEPTPRGREEAR